MVDEVQEEHAVVAVGSTAKESFPLILVFGRENNGNARIIPGISLYDESVSSGSAFWNRAYSFIQRLAFWNGHLRQSCVDAGMSPVLFTNVLPRPIPNSEHNKDLIRVIILDDEIRAHLSEIFALEVINRIRAVIFSTGKKPVYEYPREQIRKECEERNISFIEVPYFATQGMPNADLDSAISPSDAETIREIISEYRAYTQQIAKPDA